VQAPNLKPQIPNNTQGGQNLKIPNDCGARAAPNESLTGPFGFFAVCNLRIVCDLEFVFWDFNHRPLRLIADRFVEQLDPTTAVRLY
jgi:hypothetical protein